MSVHAIKFAVALTLALLSIYLGGGVGEGPLPVLMALAVVAVAVAEMRMFDRLSVGSKNFKLSDLYSTALSDVKGVKHGKDIDLIKTSSRYVAIGGLEVVDVWNTFEVLRKEDVVNLSRLHGEFIALEDVEVQIEVAKRGRNPRIRYYVLAYARSPAPAISKAKTALSELEKGLRSIQVAVRRLRCDGNTCEITRLRRGGTSLPASKGVFAAQMSLAFTSLFMTMMSPGVTWLTACIAVPSLMAAAYCMFASKNISRGSGWAPLNVNAPTRFEGGRLRFGNSLNSFAVLRRIEHYDRYLSPQDIQQLVSELNELLYSEYDFLFRISLSRREEAGYRRKQSLAMDVAWSDFESGAGLSRKLKSHKHEVRLERMRVLGEKPFKVSGFLILRSGSTSEEARIREGSLKSRLEVLGLKVIWVRGASQIIKCLRTQYLGPQSGIPVIEPPATDPFESLTMDFAWISPIALDRSPLLAKDGIYLGRDRRGRPVYWNPVTLRNAHIGIYGPPGSGKSTIVRSIILRASKFFQERYGYRPVVVIVDPAGEYRKVATMLGGKIVDMVKLKVNPLLLEGASPHERASKVAEMFRYILALKGEEKAELKDAIIEAYVRAGIDPADESTWTKGYDRNVTMKTVYEIVKEKFAKAEAEGKAAQAVVLKTLVDKMRDICEGARALDRTDVTVSDILSMGSLLCLSFKDVYGAVGLDLQRVIVWTLLEQLRDRMLADEVHEQLRVLVVIDEGHRFVQVATLVEGGIQVKVEPPLSLHLRDVRKFGVGYIFVTHRPGDMPEGVTGLMGTTIALSSTETKYLEWAAKELRLTESQLATLERAGLGKGYMIWMDDPRPLFVNFEPEKAAMVRDAVAERMAAIIGEMEQRGVERAEEPRQLEPTPRRGEAVEPTVATALKRLRRAVEADEARSVGADVKEVREERLPVKASSTIPVVQSRRNGFHEPAPRPEKVEEVKEVKLTSHAKQVSGVICPYCGRKIWDKLPLPSWYRYCTYCSRELPAMLREVKA